MIAGLATILPSPALLAIGVGGAIGVFGAALALGIRHGIDWDHIAAITDITSTVAATDDADERWLVSEPGVMFTDESHHALAAMPVAAGAAASGGISIGRGSRHAHTLGEMAHRHGASRNGHLAAMDRFVQKQRPALFLGSMYAVGHGTMVVALGLLALLASEFLPGWVDPIMEQVVGVTLIMLAAYLLYSVYQFFRGGHEFRIRSRWMVAFAAARNGLNLVRSKVFGRPREHAHEAQQYGPTTAYAVGLIHGVGAETGTQVLVIATAVGAGSRWSGVGALLAFVVGLLISNSIVTVITTAGFVSTRRRQGIYVAAGLLAAVFSLFVGAFFLLRAGGVLPDLGEYFRWVGGPD